MPGYDEATKEITRKFAAHGYLAICPNLYFREAPGASPDDAAATARAQGGVPDERLVGDVGGAAAHLRSFGSSNGKVATIGYCSGGRQSFLAACSLDLDAAVDCYGAFVIGPATGGDAAQGRARSSDWPPTCPARCSVCSEPRTSTRRRTRWPSSRRPGRGGQGLRVPLLRGRRPRFLRHRPAQLPAGGGRRRLGEDLGVLRPLPGSQPAERGRDSMCTYQTTTLAVEGSGKGPRDGSP